MRRNLPRLALLAGLVALTAAGGAVALRAIGPDAASDAGDGAVPSTAGVQGAGDRMLIHVSPSVIAHGGIAVAPLRAATVKQSREGLATVLALQPLLDQRRALVTADADRARAAIAARVARAEAARLALLHADDRIASTKALEAQQALAATEGSALDAARAQRDLAIAGVRQQWGPVIAGWLARDAAPLRDLLAGRRVLLQLSGAGLDARPPRRAVLVLAGGERIALTIVGAAAQADPRFQAAGFYALAPARPALAPGVSLPVELPGDAIAGAAVPDAAIVRVDGRAIVYVERRPGAFAPTPIALATRAQGGWLVTGGVGAGTRAAMRGAPLLLSQQLKGPGGEP